MGLKMAKEKRQLLIESCDFVSKIKIPKKLKESVKLSPGKTGTLIVRNVPVTILNRENQNGRIYSTEVVQAAIDEARPLIEAKQLICSGNEHPEGSYIGPTTAAHVIIGAYIKKGITVTVDGKRGKYDVLFNDWEVLNTQEGKNERALLEAECSIGTSIRGLGDLQGNQVIDYSYLGTDLVGNPSSSTYTRMPVSESVKVEIEEREPLTENFVVSTSSTNVVNNLEKAAVIQNQLDHATYGTVVKTHTTLDSEVDPKTGATTELTTLEAETEDEVANLDQALLMAKNAMLNGITHVDSVTIENISEDEARKESVSEYIPEEALEKKEGIAGSILGGAAGALVGHPFIGAAAGSLAQDALLDDEDEDEKEESIKEGVKGAIAGTRVGAAVGQPVAGAIAGSIAQDVHDRLTKKKKNKKETEVEEGVGGALLGGAAGALVGHPFIGAATGSLLQDKLSKNKEDRKGGWKAGAVLGGAAGSLVGMPLVGAAAGGIAQNMWEGKEEIKEAKPGFYPFMKYFNAIEAKYGDAAWNMPCNFLDFEMNTEYTGTIKAILGEENTNQWLADDDNAYYGISFVDEPLEQWLETEYKEPTEEAVEIKEAKEKDPNEGKQFVLKTPNGYVSMEGNALVFKEDPKLALHFIVGKENTGLVHLSEVENILDTMGVYDIKKYYKRDLEDISATDEELQATEEANALDGTPANPIEGQEQVNASLVEDENTPYVAVVKSESSTGSTDIETIPVSGRDYEAIIAEVGNLWRQKSENGQKNLVVEFHDNTTNEQYQYDPAANTLIPLDNQASVTESDDIISQNGNKLTMEIDPDNPDDTIEKEFDNKAQADVVKAGIEQGKIDGSIMLNEKDAADEESSTAKVDNNIKPGWYVGVDGIGVLGPYETKEAARKGLEGFDDDINVEYLGNKSSTQMDEVLYTGNQPASDPVIEQPLQDAKDEMLVTLRNIDWDIDSLVSNVGNKNEITRDELIQTIQDLPAQVTITVENVKTESDPQVIRQIILDTANKQLPYKINNATIMDIQ